MAGRWWSPLLFGGLSYLAYRSSVMAAVGYGRAVEAAFDPYHLDLFSAYATHNVLGGTSAQQAANSAVERYTARNRVRRC
jgi:hypothetical protein